MFENAAIIGDNGRHVRPRIAVERNWKRCKDGDSVQKDDSAMEEADKLVEVTVPIRKALRWIIKIGTPFGLMDAIALRERSRQHHGPPLNQLELFALDVFIENNNLDEEVTLAIKSELAREYGLS